VIALCRQEATTTKCNSELPADLEKEMYYLMMKLWKKHSHFCGFVATIWVFCILLKFFWENWLGIPVFLTGVSTLIAIFVSWSKTES